MRTRFVLCALLLSSIGATAGWAFAADEDEKPKYTIKEVMKKAHKDGLLKKVAAGKGTKDDAKELLALYEALGKNKPPKGDGDDWKAKTKTLIEAAQEVVDEKPGAAAKLEKAANCGDCHKAHKPS